jgi:serine/threonine-protein kinase HipA
MADLLDVYLNQDFAGQLEERQGKLLFTYKQTWLESERFIPLSVTMGPQRDPFPDEITRPYFENLLPEGEIRGAIAKLKQVSERNTFGLLGEIGGDCAGAISLSTLGEKPRPDQGYEVLTDERLAEMLAGMAKRPLLVIEEELRLSLAGAQNKLPLRYDGKQLSLPRGSAPSSHILKPGARAFEHMPANEHFCMRLADALGLPVPASLILRKPESLYLIERHDRARAPDGRLTRVHQIDFCQALSLPSQKKYEHEGGPSLALCFEVIKKFSSQPAKDRLNLISWTIFNYLVGNADAHAKNLSLLITREGVALAPFYDLVSTAAYRELTEKLALKIGGENRPDWIKKRHWEGLAEISDTNPRFVWQQIEKLANTIVDKARNTAEALGLEKDESETIEKILAVITDRATQLTRLA